MNPDNPTSAPVTPGVTRASASAPFVAPQTDTTLSEFLITLRKHRLVVAGCVLAGILLGIYLALTQIRLYDAFGRIEVRAGSQNEYKLDAATQMQDPQRNLQNEVQILTSDTLLVKVARDMNLQNNPDFLGARGPVPHRDIDDLQVRATTVARLRKGLVVSLVPKTDIIRIQCSSLNPKLSAEIVNRIVSDYIQRSFQTRFESTQRVSRWLSNQLDDLKSQVETSQDQLLDLQRRLGVLGFDATHNQISTSLDDLAKAAAEAKLQRILAESRYRTLSATDPNELESALGTSANANSSLTNLRTQLASARAQLAQLSATLGPNHPQVKSQKAEVDELAREVDTEQNRLLTEAKSALELARANEDQTGSALEQEKTDAYRLRDQMVEYTIKQRDFESSRTLYEELMQKLRSAGVTAGLESMEIDIVDPAVPPVSPTLKPKSTIVLTWAVIGAVAGVLVAFILESLDTGLRSIAEIESVTELPSLAIVPRAKRASPEQIAGMSTVERNINVLTQPKSQFTEAFRSLRTALLLSMTGREPKFILFTSATPSEGKTTTASNLAVIMSQRGQKVLLIDADLRRPNVHHRFGLNGKLGLSTVLSGQTTLEESVQRVKEIPDLDILASGPVPPFPTEMLSSETMSAMLRRAGEVYTHVIIDSPPILSVTDGVLLSRQVDLVVMVVRHAKSSKHVVRRGRDLLFRSGAPLAGIVLNAVDLNSPEYYGYYGYSGYSYSSLDPASWDTQNGPGKTAGKKDQV